MIFTGSRPKEKPLVQQSWEEDCLPSVEDVGIFLSEARELQSSLQHLKRIYPRFNMGKTLLHADLLVNDLEDLICDLEN